MNISVIVPAFNERQVIGQVLDSVTDYLSQLNGNHEIIVVDDGSTDGTGDIARDKNVRLITHPYNKGYGAALKTGLRSALNDVCVFFDSDGQHNPQDISKLIIEMDTYDMVVGARSKGSFHSFFRAPGKKLLSLTANYLARRKIPDLNSGFRAVRKAPVDKFMHILPNGFSFTTTITLAMFSEAYNVKYVPVTTKQRAGKSSVSFIQDGIRTILLIIRTISLFSPIRVFFPMSLLLFFMGILSFINDGLESNWKNIGDATIITFLTSVIIFFYGILADQVAHIRRERK